MTSLASRRPARTAVTGDGPGAAICRLCAVEPGYLASLSPASRHTLAVQGGPMAAEEMAAFEAHPHACDALRVRRWDDAAKDPAASPPAFGYYQPLLRRLLRLPGPRAGVARPAMAGRRDPEVTPPPRRG